MLINNVNAIPLESKRLSYEKLDSNYLSDKYVNWMNDEAVIEYIESGGNYTIEKLREYLLEQERKQILYWAIKIKVTNKQNVRSLLVTSNNQLLSYLLLFAHLKH